MSLKGTADSIADGVVGLFTTHTTDLPAQREPVLNAIGDAERAWSGRGERAEGDWFSEANGHVAFSPRLANGSPLTIDGQTTVFVPAALFPAYLANMRQAVEAGAFDAEIEAGLTGSPNVSGLATVPMPEPGQQQSGNQLDR